MTDVFDPNNQQSRNRLQLCTLRHRIFGKNALRFQQFQKDTFAFGGKQYYYRDWSAPPLISASCQGSNPPVSFVLPITNLRQDTFPLLEILKGSYGLAGAVLHIIQVDTRTKQVTAQTYQVRAAGIIGPNAVLMLQNTAHEARWPTIPAVTPTYQMIY